MKTIRPSGTNVARVAAVTLVRPTWLTPTGGGPGGRRPPPLGYRPTTGTGRARAVRAYAVVKKSMSS